MKFSHYTATPLTRVRSIEQEERPAMKPRGLWLSADGEDDWREWCMRRKDRVQDVQRLRYRVNLHMARILVLANELDLADFTMTFASEPEKWETVFINWKAVAEQYAGIIIAPHQWRSRIRLLWYYPWDCASGCVWDAAAVLEIRRLKSVRPRRRKAT